MPVNRYGLKGPSPKPSGSSGNPSPGPAPIIVVPPAERARRRALCTRVIVRAMKLKLAVAFAEWRCETININKERAIRQAEIIRIITKRARDLFLMKHVHVKMKIAFGMWRTSTFVQAKSIDSSSVKALMGRACT